MKSTRSSFSCTSSSTVNWGVRMSCTLASFPGFPTFFSTGATKSWGKSGDEARSTSGLG